MKKNTLVSWQIPFGHDGKPIPEFNGRGHGFTITDEEDGKVLVEVDTFAGEPFAGFHPVIRCTVTWLTEENPLTFNPHA